MRYLVTAQMDTDAANAAARAGKMGEKIQSILADLKPEAAYFTEEDGERTAFLLVDMDDVSRMPAIAEPWYLVFKAKVRFRPVMTLEDLGKASAGIEAAVKKFG
jgi:hypothetical protein